MKNGPKLDRLQKNIRSMRKHFLTIRFEQFLPPSIV